LWQEKYHDHVLRADERWESGAIYILNNPVRKGLCKRAEDWPYSGSFTADWRRLLSFGGGAVEATVEEAERARLKPTSTRDARDAPELPRRRGAL